MAVRAISGCMGLHICCEHRETLLLLLKCNVVFDSVPIHEETEGIGVLNFCAPVCALEAWLLGEGVESVLEDLTDLPCSIVGTLAVSERADEYLCCHYILIEMLQDR